VPADMGRAMPAPTIKLLEVGVMKKKKGVLAVLLALVMVATLATPLVADEATPPVRTRWFDPGDEPE